LQFSKPTIKLGDDFTAKKRQIFKKLYHFLRPVFFYVLPIISLITNYYVDDQVDKWFVISACAATLSIAIGVASDIYTEMHNRTIELTGKMITMTDFIIDNADTDREILTLIKNAQ
jgi:hypothetical protein